MTTIAFDGKTLAADGQMTRGTRIVTTERNKIRTPTDGSSLFGEVILAWAGSGNSGDMIFAQRAFALPGGLTMGLLADPKLWPGEISFEIICITEKSVWVLNTRNKGGGINAVLLEEPITIGSGAAYAQSAISLGMSAAVAVQHAANLDTGTGGKIFTFDVPWSKSTLD